MLLNPLQCLTIQYGSHFSAPPVQDPARDMAAAGALRGNIPFSDGKLIGRQVLE